MSVNWYSLDHLAPPTPTRPIAVVTLAVGREGRELLAVSGPFIERYAARVGADYRVIRADDPGVFPLAYKWAVARYIRAYERVFFVDADLIIRPFCPDAFAAVPDTHLGMVDEADEYLAYSPDGGRWWREQVEGIQRQLGAVVSPHPFAFNTGVYVASRWHAPAFDPPERPLDLTFCGEQHLLNERVYKYGVPVMRLGNEWNARWNWRKAECFAPENYIVHLAGLRPHADRLALLKAEAARWGGLCR